VESYAQGQEHATFVTGNDFGTPVQNGAALYKGQAWKQGQGGAWAQAATAAAGNPFGDPAAYIDRLQEALNVGQIAASEEYYDEATYIEIFLDKAEMERLFGSAVAGASEAEVTYTLWVDEATGTLTSVDVYVFADDGQGLTYDLSGTLYFEAWEQPIPFPAVMMQ